MHKAATHLLAAVCGVAVGAGGLYGLTTLRATQERGVTEEEIRSLPPAELARRLLPLWAENAAPSAVARQYLGAKSPDGKSTIEDVMFRRTATHSGWFGMCAAENIGIGLETVGERRRPAGDIRLLTTYRVVGDTAPNRPGDDAALDRRCAAESPDSLFFPIAQDLTERDITDTLAALNVLVSAPTTGATRMTCSGSTRQCASPVEVLRGLHAGRIAFAEAPLDCGDEQTCVVLYYAALPIPYGRPPRTDWKVAVKGEYRGQYDTGYGKLLFSNVDLTYGG